MAVPAYSVAKMKYLGGSATNPNPAHLNVNDVYDIMQWLQPGTLGALILDKNGALFMAVGLDDTAEWGIVAV